jgi:hypothetical protein
MGQDGNRYRTDLHFCKSEYSENQHIFCLWGRTSRDTTKSVPDPAKRPFGGARQGQNKNNENNPMQR